MSDEKRVTLLSDRNDRFMNYVKTEIPGLWILEPKVLGDARGYFMEVFKREEFERTVGKVDFVQENESRSSKGVLRGLHYQLDPWSQAKLVRVTVGCVLDVAVDLRAGSPTFGKYVSVELSAENKRQLFIPKGFAHGFQVLSDEVVFSYKVDNVYMPSHERGLRFDDPAIGVKWIISESEGFNLSDKDREHPLLSEAEFNFVF